MVLCDPVRVRKIDVVPHDAVARFVVDLAGRLLDLVEDDVLVEPRRHAVRKLQSAGVLCVQDLGGDAVLPLHDLRQALRLDQAERGGELAEAEVESLHVIRGLAVVAECLGVLDQLRVARHQDATLPGRHRLGRVERVHAGIAERAGGLAVPGGAVGVGIGLGLQKLAANYVSGFVILAERSVRIGDNVRVDGFEGRITDITGRYTVIRSPGGRESIVPNEMLISQRVENLSLADPRVWQSTVVSVGYDSDVDLVMRLLCEAAYASPRVLKEPGPSAALSAFGADGLEFTLGFWIVDPENGTLSLRPDITPATLRALRAHGIDIPFPQRMVQIQGLGPAAQAAGGAMVPNVPADLAQTPASAL